MTYILSGSSSGPLYTGTYVPADGDVVDAASVRTAFSNTLDNTLLANKKNPFAEKDVRKQVNLTAMRYFSSGSYPEGWTYDQLQWKSWGIHNDLTAFIDGDLDVSGADGAYLKMVQATIVGNTTTPPAQPIISVYEIDPSIAPGAQGYSTLLGTYTDIATGGLYETPHQLTVGPQCNTTPTNGFWRTAAYPQIDYTKRYVVDIKSDLNGTSGFHLTSIIFSTNPTST